ncbi:MAG: response regulator [Acidobacteriota bacterium]
MPTILIVDDSAFQRKFLRKTLEAAGYRIVEAANGSEALDVAAAEQPDAILTDLIMPDLRGLALLETLEERGSEIPIVVLTADIQEPVEARCLELGAAKVLHKPAKPDVLDTTFKALLAGGDASS